MLTIFIFLRSFAPLFACFVVGAQSADPATFSRLVSLKAQRGSASKEAMVSVDFPRLLEGERALRTYFVSRRSSIKKLC